MRSLIIRFVDSEGPGLISDILKEKGYQITYHNAYQKGLHLIPQAHQFFDMIVLLGGPQSVADSSLEKFFKPYMDLVRGCYHRKSTKCIGICLGSQIIAEALGGKVREGEKGREVGYKELLVRDPENPIFQGLNGKNSFLCFHLHGDTFDLPPNARLLASSEMYENQIFSVEDRIFGIQAHMEPTWEMIQVWKNVHKDYMAEAGVSDPGNWKDIHKEVESTGRDILKRIIE